jgi:hypothetical protein
MLKGKNINFSSRMIMVIITLSAFVLLIPAQTASGVYLLDPGDGGGGGSTYYYTVKGYVWDEYGNGIPSASISIS